MKTCPRCQTEKPPAEFYGTTKLSAYCRDCTKAAQNQWWQKNKKRKSDINRAWRNRNPQRRKILQATTNAVWKAIREGRLIRGTSCSRCPSTHNIEAAHLDYSKPLEVIWLCRSCHRQWDADQPKSRIAIPSEA